MELYKSFSFYTMSPQIYLLFFVISFLKVFFILPDSLYTEPHTSIQRTTHFFFSTSFAFLSLFDFFFIKYLLILIKKMYINRTSMSYYDLCYPRRHYVSIGVRTLYVAFYKFPQQLVLLVIIES